MAANYCPMKIVVLDGYTLNPGDLSWNGLSQLGELTIYDRTASEAEKLERIKDATAIFTNKVIIDEQAIQAAPKLQYIGVLATGYNVVDLEAASKAGITVTNIPAYSTDSVAQLVFSFILNFANAVSEHSQAVRSGRWSSSADFSFSVSPQLEVAGKTIGIIGLGQIGRRVAEIASVFGIKVLFQNRSHKADVPANWKQVELAELLKQSDFVSLHCPLTESTHELINRQSISLMKPSAFLINTGRGPLINEQDLAEALNQGKIAGAGLDVLSSEPPRKDNPLLTAKNCTISPHIAWSTLEARGRLMKILVENFEAYLEDKPQNVVNKLS